MNSGYFLLLVILTSSNKYRYSSAMHLIRNVSRNYANYSRLHDMMQEFVLHTIILKVSSPWRLVFATSILRIYRNNNAQYSIINSVLPVVFQIHTCFIVLRKASSITLGVFIGQKSSGRSSGSISSSVASGKIPVHNNIRRPVGIRNHTPQAHGVADKCHWQ